MNYDEIVVAPSALKRGHDPEDIRHALRRHYPFPFATDDPDVMMIVGPARSGALLEVGFLISSDDGAVVAIHCMNARGKYLRRL